jgi:choline-sulfatase
VKNVRIVILLVVVLNIAFVGWLLVRNPTSGDQKPATAVAPVGSTETTEKARYDLKAKQKDLNVILISMDALRYDRTGTGGNKEGLTPNLDSLAEESIVFHNAVSAAPWTLPSHMSVWTARWPSVHGITNKLKLLSEDKMVPTILSPGIETFPDILIREGWIAGGFTGGAGVQASFGFGRGFDHYLDDRYFGGLDHSIPDALQWLKAHQSERFFMFLHGYDAHGQYELSDASRATARGDYKGKLDGTIAENAKLREGALAAIKRPGDPPSLQSILDKDDAKYLLDVYDQKVKEADQRLGSFLSEVRSSGLLDRTIVIVMSDHGDEFMEHGALDHGATLYEEQLHVVMMMRIPGYARRHDVDAVVRTVDIFPTLFDMIGLAVPAGVDGTSLLPLLRGEPQELTAYSESDYRLFVHLRSIRKGNEKLVLDLEDGKRELYDVSKDPGEREDQSSAEPRTTYELEQALRTSMDKTRTNPQDYLGLKQKPITIF